MKNKKGYITVWKVCRRWTKEHYEDFVGLGSAMSGGVITRYGIKKKTVPPPGCGPLAAFRTREDARHFHYWHRIAGSGLEVFKAKAQRSSEKCLYAENVQFPQWKKNFFGSFPDGTILCDSITLIKKAS